MFTFVKTVSAGLIGECTVGVNLGVMDGDGARFSKFR